VTKQRLLDVFNQFIFDDPSRDSINREVG